MSSLTDFLQLFKWNSKTDGSEKFNIDTALNENWDKIESNAVEVNTTLGALSSLTTTDKTSLVNALNELRLQTRSCMSGASIQYTSLLTDRTFDEIMELPYPSVFTINGNDTTKNGAGFPTGAYEYGTLITYNSSNIYAKTQIYITDNPHAVGTGRGIWIRTRKAGTWLQLKGNIVTTGSAAPTDEYIDGKQVYRKIIDFGALPNATYKEVETGLSDITFTKVEGIVTNGTTTIPLSFVNPTTLANSIALTITSSGAKVRITTGTDRSDYTGTINLYYTKNS